MKKRMAPRWGALALAVASATAAGGSAAAGFAILEQSVKGLGTSFSNAAAADDASTTFFNAAGLANLEGTQIQAAGHVVAPSAEFTNGGSALNPAFTGGAAVPGSLAGGEAGNNSVTGLIPNLYVHHQLQGVLDGRLHFGFGINAPFALKTNYEEGWHGRYHALSSEVKTFNFNPALAFAVTDRLYLGAGFNPQYIEARLTNAFDQSAACLGSALAALCPGLGLTTPGNVATDGHVDLRNARDWSFGWNAALLWKPLPSTHVGLNYRSKVSHKLEGNAVFSGFNPALAGAAGLITQRATAGVTLPESASLHLYHALNDRWAVHGDVSWTRWSRLQAIFVNFAGGAQTILPLDWDNSFRYSGGITYRHDSRWTFRAGAAFDETPTPDEFRRTPRLPDEDRTWLSVGASYAVSDRLSFDAGYAYLIVDDPKITRLPDASTGHLLSGAYEADVHIGSVQVVYRF